MQKSKPEVKLAPFTMMFAEGYTLSLMSLFHEQAKDMRAMLESWCKPLLNASDAVFCRQLVQRGLMRSGENGEIDLSYIDLIYLELMKTVIQFGANPKVINSLKELFDERYDKSFTESYSPLSQILIAGHDGRDVEFTYTAEDTRINIFDHIFASLLLGHQKSKATMQFSLIPILNEVRKMFKNSKPIETKHSMYDYFKPLNKDDLLTDSELTMIEKVRQLKDAETLTLKRKKDESGKYIASVLSEKNDDELSRDLNALCKKYHISDFADLNVKRRKGGVADVKTSEQEII